MGQKVNPKIFRISVNKNWSSRWFAGRDYAKFLQQDITIKKYIKKTLPDAGIDRIEIERSPEKVNIIIHTAKPGLIIGRGGQAIENLRLYISRKFIKDKSLQINISIQEVKQPNLSAEVVLQGAIAEIEKEFLFVG